MKPCSEACEQNKRPILAILEQYLPASRRLLEIGSGTGQHAVFFAAAFPHLHWITSDLPGNHPGIRAWLDDANLPNLEGPLELDVTRPDWPVTDVDTVFSANTAHILPWPAVERMFAGIGRLLPPQGRFLLYGPFNLDGRYTAESNERFDAWLKERDPAMGVRDLEALDDLARDNELTRIALHDMPADNKLVVWQKCRVIER